MRALLVGLAAAQLYEPDITPQEPQRRFVVTASCLTLNATSQIRLFVAVPSAIIYTAAPVGAPLLVPRSEAIEHQSSFLLDQILT